jgi:hypothetical protein
MFSGEIPLSNPLDYLADSLSMSTSELLGLQFLRWPLRLRVESTYFVILGDTAQDVDVCCHVTGGRSYRVGYS